MAKKPKKTIEDVRRKLAASPHPKSRHLSAADLALLPAFELRRIVTAAERRERKANR